ncbi:hypothetical protein KEM52_003440, partial [Ascosphaera acerosa]
MPAMPAHPVQQCTPAERIQQLNAIDADVATLLQHASNAIAILASSDAPASQPRPTAGGDEAALGGANDPARAPRPDVADAGRDAAAATATAPADQLEQRKAVFSAVTADYFALLSAID